MGVNAAGNVVDVGGLLDDPPGILAAAAAVVVAVADPVQIGGVQGVAPHVFQRAVAAAVHGNFGVPVELAAQQTIFLAAGLDHVVAHPPHVGGRVGVQPLGLAVWLAVRAPGAVELWQHRRADRGAGTFGGRRAAAISPARATGEHRREQIVFRLSGDRHPAAGEEHLADASQSPTTSCRSRPSPGYTATSRPAAVRARAGRTSSRLSLAARNSGGVQCVAVEAGGYSSHTPPAMMCGGLSPQIASC